MNRQPFTTASWLRFSPSAGFLCKAVLLVAGLTPFLAPSVARADLYVVDGDLVGRFDNSTGAIVQTNGQNTFTTLLSATGITAGPDGLIYVATTDPTSNPGFPVVNRYNATTGAGWQRVRSLRQWRRPTEQRTGNGFWSRWSFLCRRPGGQWPR